MMRLLMKGGVFRVTMWPRSIPVSAAKAIRQQALTNCQTVTRAAVTSPSATGRQRTRQDRAEAGRRGEPAGATHCERRLVAEVTVADLPSERFDDVR
jgi:hypothetical protein